MLWLVTVSVFLELAMQNIHVDYVLSAFVM